jgi:hypothetical protein
MFMVYIETKLCYDRWSVGQSVLVSSTHLGPNTRISITLKTVVGLFMWGSLSDERMGLSFTIAACPLQAIILGPRVPRDLWPYFTLSNSRLLQHGGPGPRIYIPPEQGGPVMPTDTGLPFRSLLRLAGLRWKYSNPPQGGRPIVDVFGNIYIYIYIYICQWAVSGSWSREWSNRIVKC